MKVALLQCDNVMEKLQPEFGNYPGMVQSMFDGVEETLDFEVFDLQQGQLPDDIDAYDFFITTGSKAASYDDFEWVRNAIDFVRTLDQQRKKLIGICFGHQLMALARGGEVEKSDKGWGVGIARNEIVACPDWMGEVPAELNILTSHKDQISRLPDDTQVIARSDFCPYFVVQWGSHFLSIQGHPEWRTEYSRTLMDERRSIIPVERIERGMQSLDQLPDNALFVNWVMEFVRAGEDA